MARSRRACSISLLALTGLVALSYLQLSRVQAANAQATALPSAEKTLVNFKSRQTPTFTYAGPADAVSALQSGAANPTALAAADFDADGAMDVVAGYSTSNGGVLAVLRGNPDAYAPKDLSLYRKALQGSVPSTFLPKARVVGLAESPDLIVTGDFNRDGHQDVLVAARGGALYLLAGDGRGGLLAPHMVQLSGQVMALAATADGHVAASLDGPNGPQLVILVPGSTGPTAGATHTLPARGDAVAWGNLGGGADLAVGAGAHVVMIYDALAPSARTETVSVPFHVQALTLGDFIWDRDGRAEISVLAADGTIHILQHGTLNTAPLTAADVRARRAALNAHARQPPNPTALGAWNIAKALPYTGSASSGPVSSSAFSSPRLTAASTQDLMVLDAGRHELNILDTSGAAASPSAAVSFAAAPLAAFALPQKINASRDIVVLTAGHAAPTLIPATPPSPPLVFDVSSLGDEDDVQACTDTSVTSGNGNDNVLSLREAICEANNNAPRQSIIDLAPGTYALNSPNVVETGELQVGNASTGYNLTIMGTDTAADTIIQQTDGVDRILEEDFHLVGGNPLTISNVTMTGGNCTTGVDCGYGGGAIIAGGESGDDLTLTNVVMNGNTDNSTVGNLYHNGGAVNTQGPNLTIQNSSFSGNSAPGQQGGAIYYAEAVVTQAAEAITNSTFSNNTAGQGGALYVSLYTDPPSILGTATISGSTFTGNTANGSQPYFPYGGAIYAVGYEAAVTISNSRFAGNNIASYGTGLALDSEVYGTAVDNWWGCNAGPGLPGNDGPAEGSGGSGMPVTAGTPNPGCDTLWYDTFNSATLSFNPWLVLGISASPTQVVTGGTSALTADLTHNSNGTGGFSVPDGTSIAFGGTLGTASPTSAATTSGQAGSTFTAGGTPGAGSGTAMLDSQSVSVTINIGQAAAITSANNTTFTVGTTGSFSVTSTGSPTASLSESGALPGGVTFVDNGNGTGTLGGKPTTGGVFNISFTASNGVGSPVNQPFTLTVNGALTSTGLASSANPSTYDQPVTFTATVSSSLGTPTGRVTFMKGSLIQGKAQLAGGVATLSANLGPGSYAMIAEYEGNARFAGSNSAPLNQVVDKAPSTVMLTSSQNPSAYGQSVTFTATVSSSSGGTPTAWVTFMNGSAVLGNVQLAGGVATWATANLSLGSASITAVYHGSAQYTGNTSSALSQGVNQATTSVNLTSSDNPSNFGDSVQFTATVVPQFSGTPIGTVRFKNGSSDIGDVKLVNGVATLTTSTLRVGSQSITATYGGDRPFSGNTSPVLEQTVNPAGP